MWIDVGEYHTHIYDTINNSQLKFATWNLCLGLSNKKDIVTSYLKLNNVDICCLQETEISPNFPENILSTDGYNLELELNDNKKRAGIYVKNNVKYKRREDLEIKNHHLVVIDILCDPVIRVICLYCSFRPPGMLSPELFFSNQIATLKSSLNDNCFIMGDFNLDATMGDRQD